MSKPISIHDHPFARDFILHKAERLIRRGDFRGLDRDDLVQDFKLHLWRNGDRYDPARGTIQTFITTVVERYAASLVRKQQTHKRKLDRGISLDAAPADDDRFRPLGRGVRSLQEAAELRLDVESVRRRLPGEQRDLADRLTRDNPAQVARDRNVPRTTLVAQIRRLREPFEKSDLDRYF